MGGFLLEVGPDPVGDAAFESSDGFFAVTEFAFVEGSAFGVRARYLGDSHAVEGPVGLAVVAAMLL